MRRCTIGLSIFFLATGYGASASSAAPAHQSAPPSTSVARVETGHAARIPVNAVPRRGTRSAGRGTIPLAVKPHAYNALLYGRVTDAKTHSPLAGAVVTVNAGSRFTSSKTDSFGRFSIKIPGGQLVSVNVKISGYLGRLMAGRVSPHKRFALNLALQRATSGSSGGPPEPGSFGSH